MPDFNFASCLHLLLCCFSKTLTQSNCGRKGLFGFLEVTVPHWGRNSSQELKQRPWRKTLSPWPVQHAFLHSPGPSTKGWHCPWWTETFHISQEPRKHTTDMPKDKTNGASSLMEFPFLDVTIHPTFPKPTTVLFYEFNFRFGAHVKSYSICFLIPVLCHFT